MSTALATIDPQQLEPWREMAAERKALLKQACSGTNLNDDQFALLVEVARRCGLDPFRRQIYGLIVDGKFTVFAGIDGLRSVAARNGCAGIDEPVFEWLDEQKRIPTSCSVTVYKWGPNGQRAPYTAKCYFREYARQVRDKQTGEMRFTKMWKDMPHNQLAKCTQASALRMAFPDDLGQVYERAEFPESEDGRSRPTVRRATTVQEMLNPSPREELGSSFVETEIVDADRDPRDSEAP